MSSVVELKPCPHCGGEADLYVTGNKVYSSIKIICGKCGASVERFGTVDKTDAIAVWNKRVAVPKEQPTKFLDRARAFYKELLELERKYEVSLGAGYSSPGDEENHLMLSNWKDKGKTYVRVDDLED